MKKLNIKQIIILSIVASLSTYLVVCLSISLSNLFHMTSQNKTTRNVEMGQKRFKEIKKNGIKCEYSLYTKQEIEKDPNLEKAKLYYFPNFSGERTNYAIIAPGGGYFECDVNKVAFPCAATINKLGYTAFVLSYRYGKYSSKYAPIKDMVKAVKFITNRADEFNVKAEDYLCVGYSAGGNLVGNFASKDLGYKKYEVNKPKALALVYPWININGPVRITGNPFQELLSWIEQIVGNRYLLGRDSTKEEQKNICVQNHVDKDYPATYLIHGDHDFVVPHKQNAEIMVKALKDSKVPYKYRLVKGLNHGFGLGAGTKAEGWVKEAINFWQAQLS